MPSKTKSRSRRRDSAPPRSRPYAPFCNSSANVPDPYCVKKELVTVQRLKLSCVGRGVDASENKSLYLEFVAAYGTIYHSLRRRLDNLSPAEAGGPAGLLAKLEIHRVCEDGATFINMWFLPMAESADDRVFLHKSAADLRRYICMAYGADNIQTHLYSHMPFYDYIAAFEVALKLLNPANPNRLGLTLNFALFYHEVLGWDQHACHLAKFGFDEAVRFIDTFPEYDVSEDSFVALHVLKECMISWTSCP